ncbi:MAG: TraB/GumN family protein [Halobacteriaceae archaeon]
MSEDVPSRSGSVRLVGTAHISHESVTEVKETIREEQPDVVAVELDEGRYRQIMDETPEDLDPKDLLRGSMAFQLLAYWLLSYVQAKLGERFDIEPGADMKAAIETAEEINANLALVDRDIQVTIQRFWARLSFVEKIRLFWQLLLGFAGISTSETEIELEELTEGDVINAMLEEFRTFSPGGAEALIDERDAYIAHHLVNLRKQGYRVVAVVGAGHQQGIEQYLENPASLPPLSTLKGTETRRFSIGKALGFLLSLGFVLFFGLLIMANVGQMILIKVFIAWFLFNGIFAFVLARVAGAHWSSAALGGSVAWLTSLNPLLAPGWFAGYIELRHLSVRISDIGTLNDLLGNEELPMRTLVQEMFEVPLFRLIAIVAMTNIGSMIASILFPIVVLPLIGGPFSSIGAVIAALQEGINNTINLFI